MDFAYYYFTLSAEDDIRLLLLSILSETLKMDDFKKGNFQFCVRSPADLAPK